MRRHAVMNILLILLTLTVTTSCLAGDPILPPGPEYLESDRISAEPEVSESANDSDLPVPTPIPGSASTNEETKESSKNEETTGSSKVEETSQTSQPLEGLPSESVPDPRITPPESSQGDLNAFSSAVVGFSYPPGQDVIDTMAKYNAYAYGPMDSRTIYLSLNAGYEYNGGMSRILDILKRYDIKATIFIDGGFIWTQNELTRRIASEGHLVGNHTMGHIDLGELAARGRYDEARRELEKFEELYREITGLSPAPIFRPPSSSWSERSLELVRREGYKTYMFSFTHKDWEVDNQPDPEQTLEALKKQVFPGSLIMLHTVGETNVRVLEDFILYVLDAGYDFGLLPVD